MYICSYAAWPKWAEVPCAEHVLLMKSAVNEFPFSSWPEQLMNAVVEQQQQKLIHRIMKY